MSTGGLLDSIKSRAWHLYENSHRDVNDKLADLKRWQWYGREDIVALQQQRLAELLKHAYEHTPYYQDILGKAGVIDSLGHVQQERFNQVPLLDKASIRRNFEALKSDDLSQRNWGENTSGGSTGEPIRLIQDQSYRDWQHAVTTLFDTWTGYTLGVGRVRLWGSERDLFVGRETAKIRLGRWLRNERYLNAFRMTTEQMSSYVQEINHLKPRQILAYVESIYELSRFIEREKLTVYSPKAIMTSAGTLYPHMRQVIERVFDTKVFNRYGSREVGNIACENERHEGLLISAPTHYVELLRADGTPAAPGEIGEVVITHLANYAMPLIRYRIGDTAIWALRESSCGRAWPMLEAVTGRVSDNFLAPDGSRVHGEYFTHLFYFRDWIHKFQVIQESCSQLRVLLVPNKDEGALEGTRQKDLEDIVQKIHIVMGKNCQVAFELVDEIPPSPSGKYRYTVSKVTERGENQL